MRLILSALTIAVVLAAPVSAGDDGLTGNWKFSIYESGQQISFLLLHMESKDGKITASADPLKGAPRLKLEDVKSDGDTLKIKFIATVNTQGGPRKLTFDYEAKLPKPGAKKIYGSLQQGGVVVPAIMESTMAKTPFELNRETLLKTPTDPKALIAMLDIIDNAKENKVDAKDLQAWVDASLKSAEMYGPRYQLRHNARLLTALQAQKMYASVGAEAARKVSKQITAKMPLDTQSEILSLAAVALRNGGEAAEADALDARLDVLENKAYADFNNANKQAPLNFKTAPFKGRKGKSDRAVLIELFTGAQCPPCVACDMAFDGVDKTYKPGEAVLLQYHMHIPGPDPMANADSTDRFEYYVDAYKVRGTPTSLFNGKLAAKGGGDRDDAPEKYAEFCDVVNKLLEAPASVKLSASATRTGEKIAITAKVQDLDKPGEKMRLRLVLVEDWVRYKGSNSLQYHHRVVRAMPGGAKGVALKDKNFDHKAEIDLAALRGNLNKYLDEDYTDGPRPLRLRNLSVVAFVQNDESAEVLQAVNVPIK